MASGSGTKNVPNADESSNVGFTAPGQEGSIAGRPAPFNVRVDGANGNGKGAYATGALTRSNSRQDVYRGGMNLGGLAPVLPSLHGTVLQVGGGGLKGNTWEFFIQELTDYMGQQQMDRCDGRGGWYYHELGNSNGSNDCGDAGHSDAELDPMGLYWDGER